MDENASEMKYVGANNKEVFNTGALIAILGSLPYTCAALYLFVMNYTKSGSNRGGVLVQRYWSVAYGGGLNMLVQVLIFYILFILGVAFVQLVIYIIFELLSRRNIEVSGTKKWIFYAIELLVAFMPFVIIWASNKV